MVALREHHVPGAEETPSSAKTIPATGMIATKNHHAIDI